MDTCSSPNGDGLNDEFGPVSSGNFENYKFEIYNRYGERVFISHKRSDKWDGRFNGVIADIGTYYYIVSGQCYDGGTINVNGDLTLIR